MCAKAAKYCWGSGPFLRTRQSRGVLEGLRKEQTKTTGNQKIILGINEGFPEAVAFSMNLEGQVGSFNIYSFAVWHTASVILVVACGFSS